MNEYTWNEIIINPTSKEASNCIGKEVYASLTPVLCLSSANGNYEKKYKFFLESIDPNNSFPFHVKVVEANNPKNVTYSSFLCIILKNEELESEYVPFKDYGEFIRYYASSISNTSLDSKILSLGGIWLKWQGIDVFHMVTEIWGKGVILGSKKLNTLPKLNNEYYTTNEITTWDELLKEYTFLDGSPCGKEVRTIHL